MYCAPPPNTTRGCHNKYAEDIALNLVSFITLEDLCLLTTGTMKSNRIRKLYEPLPVPTLCVGRVEDLTLVLLFPCILDGNTMFNIPYKYAGRQKQAFNLKFW
jgi:hypothetical protein